METNILPAGVSFPTTRLRHSPPSRAPQLGRSRYSSGGRRHHQRTTSARGQGPLQICCRERFPELCAASVLAGTRFLGDGGVLVSACRQEAHGFESAHFEGTRPSFEASIRCHRVGGGGGRTHLLRASVIFIIVQAPLPRRSAGRGFSGQGDGLSFMGPCNSCCSRNTYCSQSFKWR